ncbi:MAG: hypothetical protein K0R09_659, partial [Clostridiales bacterium]|jgi:predicted MPP superfamily phosphohydrolase|nr:hypothetical protein [Clostridiales bacterium]
MQILLGGIEINQFKQIINSEAIKSTLNKSSKTNKIFIPLVAPGQGLFPKYNKGLYRLNNRTNLYIDSGVGTTAMPIRFCDRSQISLITIKR